MRKIDLNRYIRDIVSLQNIFFLFWSPKFVEAVKVSASQFCSLKGGIKGDSENARSVMPHKQL